jgi:DNA-directed RNA polymerase subunit RPC12/RpoP
VDNQWPPEWRRSSPGAQCPNCGARSGRPILWGMPTADVFEAISAGEIDVEIGGCLVTDDDPKYRCSTCGLSFGHAMPNDESEADGLAYRAQDGR